MFAAIEFGKLEVAQLQILDSQELCPILSAEAPAFVSEETIDVPFTELQSSDSDITPQISLTSMTFWNSNILDVPAAEEMGYNRYSSTFKSPMKSLYSGRNHAAAEGMRFGGKSDLEQPLTTSGYAISVGNPLILEQAANNAIFTSGYGFSVGDLLTSQYLSNTLYTSTYDISGDSSFLEQTSNTQVYTDRCGILVGDVSPRESASGTKIYTSGYGISVGDLLISQLVSSTKVRSCKDSSTKVRTYKDVCAENLSTSNRDSIKEVHNSGNDYWAENPSILKPDSSNEAYSSAGVTSARDALVESYIQDFFRPRFDPNSDEDLPTHGPAGDTAPTQHSPTPIPKTADSVVEALTDIQILDAMLSTSNWQFKSTEILLDFQKCLQNQIERVEKSMCVPDMTNNELLNILQGQNQLLCKFDGIASYENANNLPLERSPNPSEADEQDPAHQCLGPEGDAFP